MKREIKFRGKRATTKKEEWVYGDLVRAESGMNHFIIPDTLEVLSDGNKTIFEQAYEVDPSTVGQYTGLKDKNGKEIYEGDIVRVLHRFEGEADHERSYTTEGVVEYSPAEFYINGDGYSITCHFHYNASDREIIGTIHDKEL